MLPRPIYRTVWIYVSWKLLFRNIQSQFVPISSLKSEKFVNVSLKTVISKSFVWNNHISWLTIRLPSFWKGLPETLPTRQWRHQEMRMDRAWHQPVWWQGCIWGKERSVLIDGVMLSFPTWSLMCCRKRGVKLKDTVLGWIIKTTFCPMSTKCRRLSHSIWTERTDLHVDELCKDETQKYTIK